MRVLGFLTGLTLAGAVLVGCTSGPDSAPLTGKAAGSGGPPVVGRAAPEIEGEDVDGQSFKLSDYRGKVVLLDFWGSF